MSGLSYSEGVAKAPIQNDLAVVGAFGGGRVSGAMSGPWADAPAGAGEPGQAGGFDLGFSDRGHG